MKLPKTYENEVSPLNSSQPPSLTLSLSAADYAPLATAPESVSDASTRRISSSLEPRYSLRPKEDLLGVTGPSLQQSENNIHNQTSAYYSNQTIGQPSYTSKGIPNGPLSMDSNGAWANAYPKSGSVEERHNYNVAWNKWQTQNQKRGLPTDNKARKALPIFTYLTEYFPDATLAEVGVAVAGNDQHNPGQSLHWAREKSKDQLNTAFRHQWDHKMGITKDTDGQYHLAKAIWRLKAELQLTIEAERNAK